MIRTTEQWVNFFTTAEFKSSDLIDLPLLISPTPGDGKSSAHFPLLVDKAPLLILENHEEVESFLSQVTDIVFYLALEESRAEGESNERI